MEATTLPPLVTRLRGNTLRVRTGIWLLPASRLPDAANEAARYNVPSRDLPRLVLAALPEGARVLGLTSGGDLERLLDGLTDTPDASCLLVLNLDLLLARLPLRDRQQVWDKLHRGLPRRRCALLLAMPVGAMELLPSESQLDAWTREGRLAASPLSTP